MSFAVAASVGLVFGAADQYLGSLKPMVALGPWTVSVSQMSAPWLLLPFGFGCGQDRRSRAMTVGLIASVSALVAYFAMTVSPVEIEWRQAPAAVLPLLRSNIPVIVGGFVTGPLFGLLGSRWRANPSWATAVPIPVAFLLEPAARLVTRRLVGPSWVWDVEVGLGVCLLVWAVVEASARRGRAWRLGEGRPAA